MPPLPKHCTGRVGATDSGSIDADQANRLGTVTDPCDECVTVDDALDDSVGNPVA